VPRVPNAFGGHGYQTETPPSMEYEDKVVMDPRTPSDYALHAVFMRFATSAEMKIDTFLRQPLVRSILIFYLLLLNWMCRIVTHFCLNSWVPESMRSSTTSYNH